MTQERAAESRLLPIERLAAWRRPLLGLLAVAVLTALVLLVGLVIAAGVAALDALTG